MSTYILSDLQRDSADTSRRAAAVDDFNLVVYDCGHC
jgi:hypothetical protein